MKKTEKIFNAQTGEETIIERNETPQEEAERLEIEAQIAAEEEAKTIKEAAKAAAQAKLTALGLTVEDLQALGL